MSSAEAKKLVRLHLQTDKLLITIERFQKRIEERFPGSGLAEVATEVVDVTRNALAQAEVIRRPNFWLRAALFFLLLVAVAGLISYFHGLEDHETFVKTLLRFLDVAKENIALLGAAAIFLYTFERRLKRQRAIKAIRELRSLAHIVDMHQLTKDPELIGHETKGLDAAGKPLDAIAMSRYLHFCIEILSVLGKLGHVFVQDFTDAPAEAAVDNFEQFTNGLTSKIWQKLMIVDRMKTEQIQD